MLRPLIRFAIGLLTFALSGCIGLYDDISILVDKSRCNLRVGILADTHLDPPRSDKMLLKALKYFAAREVDAVVIAGDITDGGTLTQRRGVKALFDKAFPKKNSTTLIFVTGANDSRQVYADLTGEAFAPAFARDVKGYTFIGMNDQNDAGMNTQALKPLLEKVDWQKPFFCVQHLVPYGTCCAHVGRADVFDGGKVSYLLSKFPNAVAICGSAHAALTDDSAFWHGDFTCVHAGSFSYSRMRGLTAEVRTGVHHGLVMSVYDTSIVFERIDFGHEKKTKTETIPEKLGPDWTVDWPPTAKAPAETPAPQFWKDTRLMVFPSEKIVGVRFPPVLAKHTGVRACEYEVRVVGSGQDPIVKTVCSPAWCFNEDHERKAVECVFPRDDLPKGKVRVEVTPQNAFGKRGRSIAAEVTL